MGQVARTIKISSPSRIFYYCLAHWVTILSYIRIKRCVQVRSPLIQIVFLDMKLNESSAVLRAWR